MNIREAHYEFKQTVNALNSTSRADFLPNQIDSYLYKGLLKFIKHSTQFFEATQLWQDKLGTLLVSSPEKQPVLTPVALTQGLYEVNLGNLDFPYHRLAKIQVDMGGGNCNHRQVDAMYHPKNNSYTAFTEPSLTWKRVPYFLGNSTGTGANHNIGISIFFDTAQKFTISNVYVSYVRSPQVPFIGGYNHINGIYTTTTTPIDLDINSDYQDEVIRLAAQLALKDTGNPNVQLEEREVQKDQQKIN